MKIKLSYDHVSCKNEYVEPDLPLYIFICYGFENTKDCLIKLTIRESFFSFFLAWQLNFLSDLYMLGKFYGKRCLGLYAPFALLFVITNYGMSKKYIKAKYSILHCCKSSALN